MLFRDIVFLFIGIILGITLIYKVWKFILSQKLRRQAHRARMAEKEAGKILVEEGYRILQEQKRTPIITTVDGQHYSNWVQADYIVERDEKIYVVEVKTGIKATQITNSATRRQLLEYFWVYRPDGILLLDMEYGKIQEVVFQNSTESPHWNSNVAASSSNFWGYLGAFILGLIISGALLMGGE